MKNSKNKSLLKFQDNKIEKLNKVVGGFRHDPPDTPIRDFSGNSLLPDPPLEPIRD